MSYQLTESSFLPLTPPNEPSIAIDCPLNRRLYCLTVSGYRRPTLDEEEYEEYITKKHSQLFKDLMTKYGLIRWTQVGNIFSNLRSPCLMLLFLIIKYVVAWKSSYLPIPSTLLSLTLILTFSRQTHTTTETRSLVGKEHDTRSANDADFDCSSQFMSESMDSLVRMKQDPVFNASVRDVDEHFADATRTKYVSPTKPSFDSPGMLLKFSSSSFLPVLH